MIDESVKLNISNTSSNESVTNESVTNESVTNESVTNETVTNESVTNESVTTVVIKNENIYNFNKYLIIINKKMNDQDTSQKLTVAITVVLEMYRVMVSSLLVLFVPQKCNDHVCSMSENMVWMDSLYNSGLVVNFITMFSFIIMYYYEVKRENKLITYLEVNKSVASDNETVGRVLENLSVEKKENILYFDKAYQKMGYFILFMFAFNTILSGFVVYEYYLDNQTTSTYITNILFMITKLTDVYSTVNTERNIFYSAYMKGKVQFNDVDPNKKLLENVKEANVEEVNKV
jgi:hypothetical protein